jgi:hydroxymethylglutaryl-CoA lyase
MPQMADCATLVREANKLKNLNVLALVPNLKGAELAIAAGARTLTMPISASREHSLNNIGKTPGEAIEEVRRVSGLRDSLSVGQRPGVEVGISTAFGCTLEGTVSEDWVIEMAGLLAKAGADSIGLSDTTGYANPSQIKRMFRRLRKEIGAEKMAGAHLHNTRGLGLANVVAALEVDVTTFDSSLGGLGGCPFAPGATGNIVTEDLVFMLEAMGLHTGIDLDTLIASREVLLSGLPDEVIYGNVPEAGLPKGFIYASERNVT